MSIAAINVNDLASRALNALNINDLSASTLNSLTTSTTTEADDSFIPFADMLEDAVTNVYQTDYLTQSDAVKIAAGDTDALHDLTIDMAKADLAINTLVQVRNKALDAYKEIMNLTL